MEEILLSQKQYNALMLRLEKLNADVTTLKNKAAPEAGYIDNYDLLKLLQVSNRTLQRWRYTKRLPYTRIGKKFYYRADLVLARCKVVPNLLAYQPPLSAITTKSQSAIRPLACAYCPIYYIRRFIRFFTIRPG
jgi:hypothetical protein